MIGNGGNLGLVACLACLVVAPVHAQESLSGQYFGRFDITMNTPFNSGAPAPWRISTKWPADGSDWSYMVLGWSQGDSYWIWDFDSNTVKLGRSVLWALNRVTPPLQFYSPSRTKIEGQRLADVDILPSELLGILEKNSDGSYNVSFNYAIYLSLAGYPHALIKTRVAVETQTDGSLKITTLDLAPDSVDIPEDLNNAGQVGEYGPNGYQPTGGSRSDGIPGTVLASVGEDSQRGVFPFRVSPQFDSSKMVKIDQTKDCNSDGVPDVVAVGLGLDPCVTDSRGDGARDADLIGVNLQRPLDSDRDGVYDYLEGRDAANSNRIAKNIRLMNNERVTLEILDGNRLGSYVFPHAVTVNDIPRRWFGEVDNLVPFIYGESRKLPETNDSGLKYNYNIGILQYNATHYNSSYSTYSILGNLISTVDSASSSVATWENQLAIRQAALDSNPTNVSLQNRVIAAQTQLANARAQLETAVNQFAGKRELYRQRIVDDLGVEFMSVQNGAELKALLAQKKLDPDTDFRKLPEVRLTFEEGIPEGLRLFWIIEGGARVPLTGTQLPELTLENTRAGYAWDGTANAVNFETDGEKSILITGFDGNYEYASIPLIQSVDYLIDVDSEEVGTVSTRLVIAYTGEERDFSFTVPDPEPTPEPEESSGGGGGSVGWLAGLLLGGLAARQWRRRGQATVRH